MPTPEYGSLNPYKIPLMHIYSIMPLITLRMANLWTPQAVNYHGSMVSGPVPDGPGLQKPTETIQYYPPLQL